MSPQRRFRRLTVTAVVSAAGLGTAVLVTAAPRSDSAPIRLVYGSAGHASKTGHKKKPKPVIVIEPGWRIVDAPAVFAGHSFDGLADVSALGPQAAWAVGQVDAGKLSSKPLLKLWDGNSWRTDATPPVPAWAVSSGFTQVKALSANNVWIFGFAQRATGVSRGLAWHWTGVRWQITDLGAAQDGIHAVVAGPREIQVTGFAAVDSRRKAWAKRFDGKTWKRIPIPAYATQLRARTAKDIWAVGQTSPNRTTALHWTGSAWRSVAVPAKIHGRTYTLTAVLPTGPREVWATAAVDNPKSTALDSGGSALLRWSGGVWKTVAFRPTSGAPLALSSDGAGGIWFTVSKLVSGSRLLHVGSGGKLTISKAPARAGTLGEINAFALIPGTTSVWAVGGLAADTVDGGQVPAIDKYGA